MGKIVFVIFMCIFLPAAAFANDIVVAGGRGLSLTVKSNSVTGKAVSIEAVPGISKNLEMEVVGEDGESIRFLVKYGIPVYDRSGMTIRADEIVKESRIMVDFKATETGVNKARIIKVLE